MRITGRMTMLLLAGMLGLVMSGCASTKDEQSDSKDAARTGGGHCFFARSVRNFEALSDSLLIVWAPSERCPYKVEISSFCQGLKSTNVIAFNTQGSICGWPTERLLIRDMGKERSCRIGKVSRLSAEELNALLVEYGKRQADEDPDNTTPDCTGSQLSEE